MSRQESRAVVVGGGAVVEGPAVLTEVTAVVDGMVVVQVSQKPHERAQKWCMYAEFPWHSPIRAQLGQWSFASRQGSGMVVTRAEAVVVDVIEDAVVEVVVSEVVTDDVVVSVEVVVTVDDPVVVEVVPVKIRQLHRLPGTQLPIGRHFAKVPSFS